ncbi:pyridoxamine 5'-phosphate oxidase family protein [Nocardioides nanhaiensis]|uniref:Pyridoxamine 5'-phosphate oxidase family protein n=1 Tax=Nocardioides nanhaiensis TaxID=1476871 RepID=A0ABP8WAV9_9ACTN
MTLIHHAPGGRLVPLAPDECWALLREHGVGRLAWVGGEGLSVTPVNYSVDDSAQVHGGALAVVVRTTAHSTIARECGGRPVALEVDDLDEETRNGWSVLARGQAELRLSAPLPGMDHPPVLPDSWPAGTRPVLLRLEVDLLTGRRLEA